MLLELDNIVKSFGKSGEKPVLRGLDLHVEQGELLAVMGKSGCGKSTLLSILGGLTRPDSGEYRYRGEVLPTQDTRVMNRFRKENIGFILQDFALLPEKTALQNVELPLRVRGMAGRERRKAAEEYLASMGMEALADSYPKTMSGGEQQRVAIARALACRPAVLLADEPTGSLDAENADGILTLLQRISAEGTTVILVTHDSSVAARYSRTIRIADGRLTEDESAFSLSQA